MAEGMFITFEGGEGTGKTTQIRRLEAKVRRKLGLKVVLTREPGGTPLADELRRVLLDPATGDISPTTELFLFEAGRSDHCDQIRSWLNMGLTVISDRFTDSSTVYQGYAGGMNIGRIKRLNGLATSGLVPELTILLDIDVTTGLERAYGRGDPSRFDAKSVGYHQKVREGYWQIARDEFERVVLIDASQTEEEVEELIWDVFMTKYTERT